MKKETKKKLTNSDKILIIVFCALLVLVISLSILVLNKKNKNYKDIKANIIIPVTEKNTNAELSVDISDLKAGGLKEYIFKIANAKDNKVNTKELKYNIEFSSPEETELKLYKNDKNVNLLQQDKTKVTDQELSANKKTYDLYRLIIKTSKTAEDKSRVNIKIES